MQNLSAPLIFQKECGMKIEHAYVLFSSGFFFSKLRIRVSEGHFQCVHTIRFSEPTRIGSLKMDLMNGPLLIPVKLFCSFWIIFFLNFAP